jgi:hypothetical protein
MQRELTALCRKLSMASSKRNFSILPLDAAELRLLCADEEGMGEVAKSYGASLLSAGRFTVASISAPSTQS